VQRGVDPDVLAACEYGVAHPHHLWLRVSSFPLQCFTVKRGLSLLRLSVIVSFLLMDVIPAPRLSVKTKTFLLRYLRKASLLKHPVRKGTTQQRLRVREGYPLYGFM
jgi:hypothetical protein